ncbi:hypothetical protein Tsubulata_004443, partial [Turnera subulata]
MKVSKFVFGALRKLRGRQKGKSIEFRSSATKQAWGKLKRRQKGKSIGFGQSVRKKQKQKRAI